MVRRDMPEKPPSVIRETDAQAIRLARSLMRTARFGSLGVIEPETGRPQVSRVAVAADLDGTPLILVSALAAHTPALMADPRVSLLLGEPGKGDPLAHPRITLACTAKAIGRDMPSYERVSRRYLNRQPKARLYAGFADFAYFRLEPEGASLNGGFGKAYFLTAAHLVTVRTVDAGLEALEEGILAHMNSDHRNALSLYARHFAGAQEASWTMTGIDAEGFDLACGDDVRRIFFDRPIEDETDVRDTLVSMAATARRALQGSSD